MRPLGRGLSEISGRQFSDQHIDTSTYLACLACLACLAVPRLDSPRRNCRAPLHSPRQPDRAKTQLATPGLASPHLSHRALALPSPNGPCLPSRAAPHPAPSRQRLPGPSSTHPALPHHTNACRAEPSLTMPRPAHRACLTPPDPAGPCLPSPAPPCHANSAPRLPCLRRQGLPEHPHRRAARTPRTLPIAA